MWPPRHDMTKPFVTLPGFVEVAGRRLFTLEFIPGGACRGAVLYLPPFAEEMNRLRSHVAAQARALVGLAAVAAPRL